MLCSYRLKFGISFWVDDKTASSELRRRYSRAVLSPIFVCDLLSSYLKRFTVKKAVTAFVRTPVNHLKCHFHTQLPPHPYQSLLHHGLRERNSCAFNKTVVKNKTAKIPTHASTRIIIYKMHKYIYNTTSDRLPWIRKRIKNTVVRIRRRPATVDVKCYGGVTVVFHIFVPLLPE